MGIHKVDDQKFILTTSQEIAMAVSVSGIPDGFQWGRVKRGYPPEQGYLTSTGLARLKWLGLVHAVSKDENGDPLAVVLNETGIDIALAMLDRHFLED